jgi:hypothetical protein
MNENTVMFSCRWEIHAKNEQHEAVVEASCVSGGTPLRAPTADQGLAPFCRDSFNGKVRWWVTVYPPLCKFYAKL